jgi:hypothetical protein
VRADDAVFGTGVREVLDVDFRHLRHGHEDQVDAALPQPAARRRHDAAFAKREDAVGVVEVLEVF